MRDILASTKGRTQSQKDYGHDAGDYVPVLERRPTPPPFITTVKGNRAYNRHDTRTQGAYGRFGTLAQVQDTKAHGPRAHVKVSRFGGSAIGACVGCGRTFDAAEQSTGFCICNTPFVGGK